MGSNAYLSRRRKVRAGAVSEKAVAKRLGARVVPASGSMEGVKSDCYTDTYRIECKSTKHSSISLKLEWLCKIAQEALTTNRKPALTINFTSEQGTTVRDGGWVLLREKDFKELIDGS